MSIELIQERLMQSVQVGLAIIDRRLGRVVYGNDSFNYWFKVSDDMPMGTFDQSEQIAQVLEQGSEPIPQGLDVEVKPKRRPVALKVYMSTFSLAEQSYLFVEAHNQTRIKELEAMINSYAGMVERNERQLKREKERAEKLLLNIMPKSVLQELKEFGVTAPTRYEDASVIMIDFVSFTEMDIADDPAAVVTELNDIFTNFDRIVEQFGCERIKTIGDAYMAVSGVPEKDPDHAHHIARVALLMLHYLQKRNQSHTHQWVPRIGIACGAVIGSIVGIHKYVYDIFGPAVNMASRMEEHSEPNTITLCAPMVEKLKGDFAMTYKTGAEVKGFGRLDVYTLDSALGSYASPY